MDYFGRRTLGAMSPLLKKVSILLGQWITLEEGDFVLADDTVKVSILLGQWITLEVLDSFTNLLTNV